MPTNASSGIFLTASLTNWGTLESTLRPLPVGACVPPEAPPEEALPVEVHDTAIIINRTMETNKAFFIIQLLFKNNFCFHAKTAI
jgi:hypothetical protein